MQIYNHDFQPSIRTTRAGFNAIAATALQLEGSPDGQRRESDATELDTGGPDEHADVWRPVGKWLCGTTLRQVTCMADAVCSDLMLASTWTAGPEGQVASR